VNGAPKVGEPAPKIYISGFARSDCGAEILIEFFEKRNPLSSKKPKPTKSLLIEVYDYPAQAKRSQNQIFNTTPEKDPNTLLI